MFIVSKLLRQLDNYRKLRAFGIKTYKKGYKKGFAASTINVCGITKDNYHQFLNDKDYVLGHPYNGPYSAIIDNKLWLPMLLYNYKDYLPKYYFFIDEGGLLPLEGYENSYSAVRIPISAFFDLLLEKHKLCLKHTHSSVGKGFMIVELKDSKFYVNNDVISKEKLENLILSLRQYIVTEYVVQHSYASAICNTSLNTIRFLCIWDSEKKEFFLARCFHRFGCNGNIVDNLGSGNGYCSFINVDSGEIMSDGAVNKNHSGDISAKNIIHPDSKILLTGIKIPNFQNIKSKVLEISNSISFLRYLGFDLAITEDGFKIIEINSFSSLEVSQQRRGFFTDERIKRIFCK